MEGLMMASSDSYSDNYMSIDDPFYPIPGDPMDGDEGNIRYDRYSAAPQRSRKHVAFADIDLVAVHPDDDEDVDEYEAFDTDFDKYMFDQQRFNGLVKVKVPRKQMNRKKANNAGVAAKKISNTNTSNNSQLMSRATRSDRKYGVRIDFDRTGRLWYSYVKDEIGPNGSRVRIYVSERAVFHHWIRAFLSRSENSKGSYAFPQERKTGLGNWDKTCFNNMQRYWGLEREHYAPVMFEYENLRRKNPRSQIGNLYYRGRLVIDYWLAPVRAFQEIPLVISSQFAGGFMEPALRIRPDMMYHDIKARMPPFIETKIPGKKKSVLKPIYDHNTLSGRARRFREQAGAISWRPEASSAYVKSFIDACPSQAATFNNSTRHCTDLSAAELRALRAATAKTAPYKAKKTTTAAGRAKYKRDMETLARKSSLMGLPCPMSNDQAVSDVKHDGSHDEPTRHAYQLNGPRAVEMLTLEEARKHPDVDLNDPRNRLPATPAEVNAIQDALLPIKEAAQALSGCRPNSSVKTSYVHQVLQIQTAFIEAWPGPPETAPYLPRRQRWLGGILDWETGVMAPPSEPEDIEEIMTFCDSVSVPDFSMPRSLAPRLLALDQAPVTDADKENLQFLLKPTLAHLAWFTGNYIDGVVFEESYIDEYTYLQYSLIEWNKVQCFPLNESDLKLIGLAEFTPDRAIWNMKWEPHFGERPDLEGIVGVQLELDY